MRLRKLDEFMVKRGGSINPNKFKDEIFELLSIPAFDKGEPEFVEGGGIGSSKKIVEPNDVLLSKIVPHIRRCWVVPKVGAYRQIASGEWIQFRSNEFVPEYVRHFLTSDPFHSQFMKTVAGVGGSLLRARPAEVANIKIPIPSLDDQVRIAHLLSKVEGMIAQRKKNLKQLDELLRSVFLEMFGDPIANPMNFPVRKLSEFYISHKDGTKCGPFGSALKKEELVDAGVPVWNMDNIDPTGRMSLPFRMWITEAKYRQLASYSVIDGDIIISRAGTVGKMCVAKMDGEPGIISTNLIRLRFGSDLLPLYVVSLMTYCKGRIGRLRTGPDGTFTHMNTGILDKLEFPYPPIDLQNQFATIVEKVEGIQSHYQHSLTELENLYGALSQKAFKGELDLSRIPLDQREHEGHKVQQEKAAPPSEQGLSERIKTAIENLNAFSQSATSLKAAQEATRFSSTLDFPLLNAVKEVTERLAALRSPLQELQQMAEISKVMEQAQTAIKPLNLEDVGPISKAAELARSIIATVPPLDLSWLEQLNEALSDATVPSETMRRAMEESSMPARELQELFSLPPEVAKVMEQAQAAINSLKLADLEPIGKAAELARAMTANLPPIDLGWLEQLNEALGKATAPSEAMRKVVEEISMPPRGLQELLNLPLEAAKVMEQAQAAIKSLNREDLEPIGKAAELARAMAVNIPTIDLSWLEQQSETMRSAMEQISTPFKELQESLRLPSVTAKRLQGNIPDFSAWQKQAVDPDAADFDDEEEAVNRPFTREDVTAIFSYAVEPLSFDSFLYVLSESELVDFVGYETIKTILFDLLAEQKLTQFFDEEQKSLLLRTAR